MRIFSNRKRAFAAGPYPTEWLPRGEHPQPWTPRPAPPIEVGEQSFTHVLAPVHDVFVAERTADVAPGRAPLPSPEAALANVKGYCYFLDADIVGITRLEPADWSGAALTGHTHAIAIVISHGRPVEPDEPGSAWIAEGERASADLRALEVATVLARYLGTLGFAAAAHTTLRSDVDLDRVGVEAGALDVWRGHPAHPFVRSGYAISVVTTDLDLPTDAPLASRTRWQRLSIAARHAVGWGGTHA